MTSTALAVRPEPRKARTTDAGRKLIEKRLAETGIFMSDLSIAAGMSPGYIHQFLKRGAPIFLSPRARLVVCSMLNIEERLLARPDEQVGGSFATTAPLPARRTSNVVPGPGAHTRDVPAYFESQDLIPNGASESIARLPETGASPMIAVRMQTARGLEHRIGAGDIVYLETMRAPRIEDLVVGLTAQRIAAIGRLISADERGYQIEGSHPKAQRFAHDSVLRVAGVLSLR